MTESPDTILEPEDTGEGVPIQKNKGKRALANVRRELSDKELSSSAVQRLLIDENERLEVEVESLKPFRSDYYQSDKDLAVAREKLASAKREDFAFGVCLALGVAAMTYSPTIWEVQPTGSIALVFGLVLVVCGIIVKVKGR